MKRKLENESDLNSLQLLQFLISYSSCKYGLNHRENLTYYQLSKGNLLFPVAKGAMNQGLKIV